MFKVWVGAQPGAITNEGTKFECYKGLLSMRNDLRVPSDSGSLSPYPTPSTSRIDTSTAEEVAKCVAEKLAPVVAKGAATEIATKLAPSVAESTAKEIATRLAPEAAKQPAIDTATKVANEVASQLVPEAARQPAVDTATKIATKIANETTSAVEGAMEAAQDMRDFQTKNMRGFESLRGETQQVIRDASKRAPAVVQKFSIPKDLTPKVPRLALYDFLVLCGKTKFSFRLDPINKFSKLTRTKIIVAR
jgi:hypothetical protein